MFERLANDPVLKGPMAPPAAVTLWIGATILLALLYAFVFRQTLGEPYAVASIDAVANVAPLSLLAIAMHALLRGQVMTRSVPVQIAINAFVAPVFATTWYALIIVMLGFFGGLQGGGYRVSGFSGPAFTWQVFQGLILYAAIAAVCYAIRGGRQAAELTIVTTPTLERYLTRHGDEIVPIQVRDIVSIVGAQDYSEVATLSGQRHLVRLSLGEFERRLDASRFLRIHRSTIINFDHLSRIEAAGGGRLLAHMAGDETFATSRAGAVLLRQFVV